MACPGRSELTGPQAGGCLTDKGAEMNTNAALLNFTGPVDTGRTGNGPRHGSLESAKTDCLTGLPNRAMFEDELVSAISIAPLAGGRKVAVLFIDLDRFK